MTTPLSHTMPLDLFSKCSVQSILLAYFVVVSGWIRIWFCRKMGLGIDIFHTADVLLLFSCDKGRAMRM